MARGGVIVPITLSYGPDASQVADLHLPREATPPVVALLHGGFWRMPHGREQLDAVAEDLARRGFAAWNVGYRRLGQPGVGWPEIAADVLAALAFLDEFGRSDTALDLHDLALVGHSAGGHLALACTSARAQAGRDERHGLAPLPSRVVALAPVTDLEAAYSADLGRGAAGALLGGSPDEVPDRYADASPIRRLPHGCRLLLVHGREDAAVPATQSRDYAAAARAAGDDVSYVELPDAGHMDFLEPQSDAHRTWREWLHRTA